MNSTREDIFWDLIDVLDKSGFLRNIMVVGSWAEYLYANYFEDNFLPNIRTHDIDVYYINPFLEINGAENLRWALRESGFIFYENPGAGSSFFKEGIEVEFLLSSFKGKGIYELPLTGISAESLDNMDMLCPMNIDVRGYHLIVPTPASYIAHKLFINPNRRPEMKRPKDIEAVRELLRFIKQNCQEQEALRIHLAELPEDKLLVIKQVAESNGLDLP